MAVQLSERPADAAGGTGAAGQLGDVRRKGWSRSGRSFRKSSSSASVRCRRSSARLRRRALVDIHTTLRHRVPTRHSPYAWKVSAVVGFDLDMTLVDSHVAITSSLDHVCRSYGVRHSAAELGARVGLPLAEVLDDLVPGWMWTRPPAAIATSTRTALSTTTVMTGAASALTQVNATGGTTAVVTAKREDQARMVPNHVGLNVDHVIGDAFGLEKGDALSEIGAQVYVGDHPGDMAGARRADAIAIGLLTGGQARMRS